MDVLKLEACTAVANLHVYIFICVWNRLAQGHAVDALRVSNTQDAVGRRLGLGSIG